MNRTTAAGTTYRLAPTADGTPSPKVERVIDAAAKAIGLPGGSADLFVADHNHGDVEHPGSWSIAFEGGGDWPFSVRKAPAGLTLGPIASWCLGVHPA